jgi:hypothetical protein
MLVDIDNGYDVFTIDKARAHAGMDLIPGNLASARLGCGQATCHASIIPRVERSLMATMSGIVAVNRTSSANPRVRRRVLPVLQLGRSTMTHLRQLCASATSARKRPPRRMTTSRAAAAATGATCPKRPAALAPRATKRKRGAQSAVIHPALSLDIDNGQCFGCHSRSGASRRAARLARGP